MDVDHTVKLYDVILQNACVTKSQTLGNPPGKSSKDVGGRSNVS